LDIEGGIVSFLVVIGISAIGWGVGYSFQKRMKNTTVTAK
jgi:hypothetical protein